MALYDPKEFPVEAPAINEVTDRLAEARRLIEGGWLQRLYAQRADGVCVQPADKDAVSFCMVGALSRALHRPLHDKSGPEFEALTEAIGGLWPGSISVWNDVEGRTQAEVVEAFRKAEAIARGQQ